MHLALTVNFYMVWSNLLCKVALTTAILAGGMAYMPAYLTCRDMPTGGIGTSSSTWESFATMAPPLQLHHVADIQPSCASLTAEKSENALTGLLLAGRAVWLLSRRGCRNRLPTLQSLPTLSSSRHRSETGIRRKSAGIKL